MAAELYRFSVTIPAGTAIATPQVTPLTMPSRIVSRVVVRVPPGPRGTVGFAFSSGGVQMIPNNEGAWVVADDEKISWDLAGQIDTGAWQLTAYNLGAFNHTLEIRFECDPTPQPANLQVLTPIPSALLSP